jgi:hypothetical protein
VSGSSRRLQGTRLHTVRRWSDSDLMMAEMGAEVLKVELTPDGDKTRVAPTVVDGRSGYYIYASTPSLLKALLS